MIFRTAAAATLALAAAACTTMEPMGGMTAVPNAAAEAAFRHVFANNASAFQSNVSSYCVGLGERSDMRDPDAALLTALRDVRPAVVPASTCRMGERALNASGQPALIFTVAPVRCEADTCVVRAGYYEGNLSAQTNQYTLRRMGDRWSVDTSQTQLGPVS